jgi:PAS domain S-box-containing protein
MVISNTLKAIVDKNCFLAKILEGLNDAVITVNENGDIVIFNHKAEIVFGCNAEKIINTPLTTILPGYIIDDHGELVKSNGGNTPLYHEYTDINFNNSNGDHSQINAPNYIKFKIKRNTGEEFPVEAIIIKTAYEGKIFFTLIIRDIIEEYKHYNDQIKLQHDIAEYKRRVKQQLIKEVTELSSSVAMT